MISHKKKFVFVHVPRTGGNSIQRAIGQWSEDKQNITKSVFGPQQGLAVLSSRRNKHYKHHTIQQLSQKFLTKNEYNTYFKFTSIRNPWERLVSLYMWDQKSPNPSKSFKKFLEKIDKPQSRFIMIDDDNLGVDFVIRFENLQEDFDLVCQKIDIAKAELPHINKSKHDEWRSYYDDETREYVAEHCAKDIKLFGYMFEEKPRIDKIWKILTKP